MDHWTLLSIFQRDPIHISTCINTEIHVYVCTYKYKPPDVYIPVTWSWPHGSILEVHIPATLCSSSFRLATRILLQYCHAALSRAVILFYSLCPMFFLDCLLSSKCCYLVFEQFFVLVHFVRFMPGWIMIETLICYKFGAASTTSFSLYDQFVHMKCTIKFNGVFCKMLFPVVLFFGCEKYSSRL